MKLATLKDGSRDGQLVVVARDLQTAVIADAIAPNMQRVIEDWPFYSPQLEQLYDALNQGRAPQSFAFDPKHYMAPLPRAYQCIEAQAYPHHFDLLAQALQTPVAEVWRETPLQRYCASDAFSGPTDEIVLADPVHGLDFAAGLAVITTDVGRGSSVADALGAVRLLLLVNQATLRNLTQVEPVAGFGALEDRLAPAFSPVAVTADELGQDWRQGVLNLSLRVRLNGKRVAEVDCGADAAFHFGQLIAHAARTRAIHAGSILTSGTVSNTDAAHGYCAIIEKRCRETIAMGAPQTGYLQYDDRLQIEMPDHAGKSIFGAIDQSVVAPDEA